MLWQLLERVFDRCVDEGQGGYSAQVSIVGKLTRITENMGTQPHEFERELEDVIAVFDKNIVFPQFDVSQSLQGSAPDCSGLHLATRLLAFAHMMEVHRESYSELSKYYGVVDSLMRIEQQIRKTLVPQEIVCFIESRWDSMSSRDATLASLMLVLLCGVLGAYGSADFYEKILANINLYSEFVFVLFISAIFRMTDAFKLLEASVGDDQYQCMFLLDHWNELPGEPWG